MELHTIGIDLGKTVLLLAGGLMVLAAAGAAFQKPVWEDE